MKNKEFPKVMIVSRCVWNDVDGLSNTLTSFFKNYDPNKLAHIYIDPSTPNTKRCNRFFRISETAMINKLFKWNTKTGMVVENTALDDVKARVVSSYNLESDKGVLSWVRRHRSGILSIFRELLWLMNGWKSKELKQFIDDFSPDVIWVDVSPLILMNRLGEFVIRFTGCPVCSFIGDDLYTYEGTSSSLLSKIHRCFLRISVKKIVVQSYQLFVSSVKMKREYDAIFGTDSVFLTKTIDVNDGKTFKKNVTHTPVRMVYLGKTLYGRIFSLIEMAKSIHRINQNGIKLSFDIYTDSYIPDDLKNKLLIDDGIRLNAPVPYAEVPHVIENNDVVVFVESFEKGYNTLARLSFSTKIIDYLSSGKCLFALGPAEAAPIEYLKQNDIAIVAENTDEIEENLKKLCNSEIIEHYSEKAWQFGMANHNTEVMDRRVFSALMSAVQLEPVVD